MRLILNIILILLIVSTVSICLIKPDMHKTVLVYDSAYTIVPEQKIEIEKETIPIMEQPAKPKQETVKIQTETVPLTKTVSAQSQKTITYKPQTTAQVTKTVSKTTTPVNTTTKKKPVQTVKTEVKSQKTNVSEPVKQTAVQPKVVEQKTVTKQETPVQPPRKVLTQQEENIAWNIWRSNLQNKIMQDTKLPSIPNGVIFKFSFTVDSTGRVSNVQTWSETQGYTPYAIQYIAPVIRSYQGRSILTFPEGTARTSTEVKGGWRISQNERYSSPTDYNDIEWVRR